MTTRTIRRGAEMMTGAAVELAAFKMVILDTVVDAFSAPDQIDGVFVLTKLALGLCAVKFGELMVVEGYENRPTCWEVGLGRN